MGGACVLDDCVPSKTLIASAGVRVELRRAAELGVQRRPRRDGRRPPTVNAPRQGPRAGPVRRRARAASSARASGSSAGRRAFADEPSARGAARSSRPARPTAAARSSPPTSCSSPPAPPPASSTTPSPTASASSPGASSTTCRAARAPRRGRVRRHRARSSCSAYVEMGARVTLVSSRDRVLPGEDADAAAVLQDVFAERGVEILAQAAGRVGARATATAWSSRSPTAARSPARTR